MNRLVILAAFGAAACMPNASQEGTATPPPANGDQQESGMMCDAGAVQDLVGKSAAEVQAEARKRSGARTVRVYETGSPITMDLRPDRLNLETDANGVIVRISCG